MELIIGQINLCDVFTTKNILHHTLKGLESNWFTFRKCKSTITVWRLSQITYYSKYLSNLSECINIIVDVTCYVKYQLKTYIYLFIRDFYMQQICGYMRCNIRITIHQAMRTGIVLNDVTPQYKTNINFYMYWFKIDLVISEFLHKFK